MQIYRIDHDRKPSHALKDPQGWRLIDGDIFGSYAPGQVVAPASCRVLAPVEPSKIVAVGLNYRSHAAEMDKPLPAEPLIFMKPSTAVIGPGDPIRLPAGVGRVDHEAEVGVVIGRRARHVPAERAAEYILGLTCINDVTARDLQRKDVQYTRAKSFDTFAPVGPCITTGLDWTALRLEGWVNDECRQRADTSLMIYSIPHLVSWISAVMTLLPGDLIATGTPQGIGPIKAGDRVTIKVEGVGELSNPVELDAGAADTRRTS